MEIWQKFNWHKKIFLLSILQKFLLFTFFFGCFFAFKLESTLFVELRLESFGLHFRICHKSFVSLSDTTETDKDTKCQILIDTYISYLLYTSIPYTYTYTIYIYIYHMPIIYKMYRHVSYLLYYYDIYCIRIYPFVYIISCIVYITCMHVYHI